MAKRSRRPEGEESAQHPQDVDLPKPAAESPTSLLQALRLRKTTREISEKKLPLQTLSDLLWAGCGVNRKQGPFGIPGRAAATASNSQEVDVYVALEDATYLYDPIHRRLLPAVTGDLRRHAIGRGQDGAGVQAPVRLLHVADLDRSFQRMNSHP
jgi:hypothetical protein